MNRTTLFGYPVLKDGMKTIVESKGPYENMLMDVHVYEMKKDEVRTFHYDQDEMAVLLLEGTLELTYCGETVTASRRGIWEEKASALHVARNTSVSVKALENSSILVQRTENSIDFPAKFYGKEDVRIDRFGQDLCSGKAVRDVTTLFDYKNAPYSNMVLGESFTHQGSWSSYIPHSHDQPEVYYYRFDKPQGFGACFVGDEAFKITDGSFSAIPGGLVHPQVSAPGYRMYYVWMIRHLPENPWTSRVDAPEHLWMIGETFDE